jgi:hypothetical protein
MAALAALGVHQPGSDAAPGSALAGQALAPIAELPKDWANPLPTSGFWVLNLGHSPPPNEPAPAASPAAPRTAPTTRTAPTPRTAPTTPDPISPPSARRRHWFAFRRPPRATVTTAPAAPVPTPSVSAVSETAGPVREAPRLISADRYDLSEP